jgi:UDP-N-acetylglucosamine diphosphorylase/glucosamine-1-phosphate N-acetyltransferase
MIENLVITILAAGEGKRMKSDVPKVLHLFNGKPMLVRIIETTLLLNPKKIVIITGKFHELIKTTLSDYFDINNSIIEFVIQKIPQGTGDAIRCCLSCYDKGDKVLILNGDMPLINKEVLEKFIQNSNNSDMSILVARLTNPYGYGRIIFNEEGEFTQIIEEKDCNEEQKKMNIVNSGLYFITSEILQLYIPFIENINAQKEYYLTDIVKIVKENKKTQIHTYLIDEKENSIISGVNTPEELFKLELAF